MRGSSIQITDHELDPLLRIESLKVYFSTNEGIVRAVDGIDLSINKGETLCLVGESGSGKSVTALSIVRLLSIPPARIVSGNIYYKGHDLLKVSDKEIRNIRGDDITYIFQDTLESLNPLHSVVEQIAENLKTHRQLDHEDAIFEAIRMMQIVGIPAAEERASSYPHQFSGGMRQRVMTAIALSCNPTLLIADEPTTSLDVSIQAQVLSLIKDLQRQYNTSVLFITHDFAIVAEIADRIAVMYAGEIVEEGILMNIFESPAHPYTQALFQSIPQIERKNSKRKKLKAIAGSSPNMISPPNGCRFNPRCDKARSICRNQSPPISKISSSQIVRCHLYTNDPQN